MGAVSWPKEKPATEAQMRLVERLLVQLGYEDPRRNPMVRREYGLTQAQATRGNFTFNEASRFIDRLKADLEKRDSEITAEEVDGLDA